MEQTLEKEEKWYASNKIKLTLIRFCMQNELDQDELIEKIAFRLNRKNRLTAILNNTYPPTLEELVVIADELDCKLDDLIITKSR